MWVQPNTSVVRAIARGQWQAPLGSSRPTTRSRAACRRARVHQGQAFGGAEEAPSLTAAARDGDVNMRSGRKNARGAGRTKEWNDKGKPHTSRMPESGPYGSVRGARGNSRPYRESHRPTSKRTRPKHRSGRGNLVLAPTMEMTANNLTERHKITSS